MPHIHQGKSLREQRLAHAMIDVSDGVSSDLAHICDMSGTGAVIYADKLPVEDGVADVFKTHDAALNAALNGGEDFVLLFTADDSAAGLDEVGAIRIGEITSKPGELSIVTNGDNEKLTPAGFTHF
jgi:thiamine-monophosphate kinase